MNEHRLKKDGSAAIRMLVIIDREKEQIPLKISWDHKLWDAKKQLCKPRQKNDKLYAHYTLIIEDARAKAIELFVQYRLRGLNLTLKEFLLEYRSLLN